MNKDGYMTTEQAKEFLGVSHQTIYKLTNARQLNPVRFVGNINYYKIDELEKVKAAMNAPKPKRKNELATMAN